MSQEKEIVHKSKIDIKVGLSEQRMPLKIHWSSTDGAEEDVREAKAMLLSMFDVESRETFKLDLWTTELQVQEMDRLMYYTLRGMADTYAKATRNEKLADAMRQLSRYFGEETGILEKPKNG